MSRKRWTVEQFIEAIRTSKSKAEVLKKVGLKPAGGSYLTFDRLVEDNKIDTSHFLGMGHLRGGSHSWGRSTPLEQILVARSTYQGGCRLKQKLFKAGLLENKCSICGQLPEWKGKPLTLELDHINGIHDDNRLENLRILCGHCHSQTETYCGKNKRKGALGQIRTDT